MTTPATGVYAFAVTIPAGTTMAQPFAQDCPLPLCSVVNLRWRVPPGPSGYMGFQVTSDNVAVIPQQAGAWIVADNESADWPLRGYPTSGNWQLTGYNTDNNDHTVYLEFLTVPPGQDVSAPASSNGGAPAVSNQAISQAPPDVTTFDAGVQVPT